MDVVISVAWSQDGARLGTGSLVGRAKVWDAAGCRELLTLRGHTNQVRSVAWSPDGTRLATGSWDGTAKVWETAGGRELLTLKGPAGAVFSVAWSPDGARLATGSSDGTAKVWEAADAAAVQQWARQDRAVHDLLAWRALKDLAIAHTKQGRPEEAAAAFTKLLELAPESHRAVVLMNLAELDQKAGRLDRARHRWAQALEVLTRAVAQRPGDRQPWRALGIVRADLGQPEKAAAAFAKLLELTPDSRAESLWWDPDPAGIGEALAPYDEIFGRVVRARPRDRNLLIARFHYFGRRRRWREAAEMAARIIEVDPEDQYAREYHRALLFFSGDVEGYRRACREAVAGLKERNRKALGLLELLGQFEFPRADATGPPPQNEDESLYRGINDYREGRYAGAIHHLTEVTRLSTHPFKRTLAHLFLAMAHQRLGQVAEARRELDAARPSIDSLGGADLTRDSPGAELMSYLWIEWVFATIVLREAESLILYDPIFPADPFDR
jgi:tetratricopeptide (TPR) repeat protein